MARKAKATEVIATVEPVETVTSIKAFDSNLKCRDFQFEVGKTYTATGKIVACQNGFHAVDADDPIHVWDFYPVIGEDGKLTRYAEVTQAGAMDRETQPSGTKIASASLTVNVEISLPDFIKRAVSALIAKTKEIASGDYSKLAAWGHYSSLAASGYSSKLAASGYSSKLAASGDSSSLAASGYSSKLAASGDSSNLAASGHSSNLAASGHSSKLAASGHSSKLAASGHYSVIAASGPGARAMGVLGTWITIAEFDDAGKCVGFATGCIGQDGLEPNAWYVAKGGKLVRE